MSNNLSKKIFLLFPLVISLTSCNNSFFKLSLDTPNIEIQNFTTIKWEEIKYAKEYKIFNSADNNLIDVTSALEYTFENFTQDFSVYIKASFGSSDIRLVDSSKSNVVNVSMPKLNAPEIRAIGNRIYWEKVNFADFYEIYGDNKFITKTDNLFYVLTDSNKITNCYVTACYDHDDLKAKNSIASNKVDVLPDHQTIDLSSIKSKFYIIDAYVKEITFFGTNNDLSIEIAKRNDPIIINLLDCQIKSSSNGPVFLFEFDKEVTINILDDCLIEGGLYGQEKNYATIKIPHLTIINELNKSLVIKGGEMQRGGHAKVGSSAISCSVFNMFGNGQFFGGNGNTPTYYGSDKAGGNGGDGGIPIVGTNINFNNSNIQLVGGNGGNGGTGGKGSTGKSEWDSGSTNGGKGGNGGNGGTGGLSLEPTAIYVLNNSSVSVINGNGGNGGTGGNGGDGGIENWTGKPIVNGIGESQIHVANGGSNGFGGNGGNCYNYNNFNSCFTVGSLPKVGEKGKDGTPGEAGVVNYPLFFGGQGSKKGEDGTKVSGSQVNGSFVSLETKFNVTIL